MCFIQKITLFMRMTYSIKGKSYTSVLSHSHLDIVTGASSSGLLNSDNSHADNSEVRHVIRTICQGSVCPDRACLKHERAPACVRPTVCILRAKLVTEDKQTDSFLPFLLCAAQTISRNVVSLWSSGEDFPRLEQTFH